MNSDSSLPTDFAAHIGRLRNLPQHVDPLLRRLFDRGLPIHIARAPGRLDIMGGIGDYSGSLVLELPIAEAAFAAVQITSNPGLTIATLRNEAKDSESWGRVKSITATEWAALRSNHYESARAHFAKNPNSAWAAYIAGPALVLLGESGLNFDGGLRVLIDSHVPEGKGVSSSAAVEVATMRAVSAALKINLNGETLACWCQLAENQIVGAPCGIMDQMTSTIGRKNELLALHCQPATIEGFVPVPDEIAFWAIDSGVRHSVGGSDYTSVRCGAFMGYRIITDVAGFRAKPGRAAHTVEVDDPAWNSYLANITPCEFQARFAAAIPDQMSGREFRNRYTGTTDHVTCIDPDRTYAVKAPTLHPIEENQRAERFRTLLQNPISEQSLHEMGELMAAAHASYTNCGLATPATDLLVNLVRDSSPATGVYGAKITGGGSGGAVAILGRSDAEAVVAAIARQYADITGRDTYLFRGSSPGAYSTPVEQVVI